MSLPILVLDANAFIKYSDISALSQSYQLVTHESVLDEIKDPSARQKLQTFEHLLDIQYPSTSAMDRVKSYAKKTGDLGSISQQDICIIALAVTIVEKNKQLHLLRKEPLELEQAINKKYKEYLEQNPITKEEDIPEPIEEEKEQPQVEDEDGFIEVKQKKPKKAQQQKIEPKKVVTPIEQETPKEEGSDSESDDGKGWISEKNINQVLNMAGHSKEELDLLKVAIMTSDFAMQNVIIQMGIKLLATDGMSITRAKRFVLECFSCENICRDTQKLFCPSCGNDTLLKLSCSLNADGTFKFYRKKGHVVRTKGFIYSIPKPKGGRKNDDLILREDELLMHGREQKLKQAYKKKEKAYEKAQIEFENGMGFQKIKQNHNNIKIGHGKKNVNDRFSN